MEMKFKVGDIVRFSDDEDKHKHKGVGEIITINPINNAPYGIFSKDIVKGHDFGGYPEVHFTALNKGSDRNCWWFDEWKLELVEEPIEETKVEEPIEEIKVEEKSRNELDKEVWERILFKNHLITIVKRDDFCEYEYADIVDTNGNFIDKLNKENTHRLMNKVVNHSSNIDRTIIDVLQDFIIIHNSYTKEQVREFCRCFSLTYDEVIDNCYINIVGDYVIVVPD